MWVDVMFDITWDRTIPDKEIVMQATYMLSSIIQKNIWFFNLQSQGIFENRIAEVISSVFQKRGLYQKHCFKYTEKEMYAYRNWIEEITYILRRSDLLPLVLWRQIIYTEERQIFQTWDADMQQAFFDLPF